MNPCIYPLNRKDAFHPQPRGIMVAIPLPWRQDARDAIDNLRPLRLANRMRVLPEFRIVSRHGGIRVFYA